MEGLQAPRRQGLAGRAGGLYPSRRRTRLATRACSSWRCGNYSCNLASEQQPKVTMACQIWQHGRQRGVHTRQPPVHRHGWLAKSSAARCDPCLRNASPSCHSVLAPKGNWYWNDHATASVRRSRSKNIDLHLHKGSLPICQKGDNSALCGLGMLFGSLGEVHAGCAKTVATTRSWQRAPARLKTGCESNVT